MESNADIEMRWVEAWSELYDIIHDSPNIGCKLPDGQFVDVEACKGWRQSSVYEGWCVKVEEQQENGKRVVVASRWK